MATKKHDSGVRKHGISLKRRLSAYFKEHQRVLKQTVRQFLLSPIDTLMTCSVIAIALALPVGFYLFLQNIEALSPSWQGHTQISLFLNTDQGEKESRALINKLNQWPEIQSINAISKEQAMEEFQQIAGISDVLQHLPDNPLPIVLEISPTETGIKADNSKALLKRLQALEAVDIAQLDLAWVQRLSIIIVIGQRLALGLIILLSAGVLLVIGNTIRLEIENRRQEIEVAQLVGATHAFVRRPFLYTGIGYGFLGGILAMSIISAVLWALSDPIAELSGLYSQQHHILTLNTSDSLSLMIMAILLGFVGAWLSVNRHLEQLQPR